MELGKSTNERSEARFMIVTIEPCYVPSAKRSFHGKFEKASTRVGLKTYAPYDLSVSGT
jgi:hypothetical protein